MDSQGSRIIKKLKQMKLYGVPNYTLSRIALKYSSRIAELRQDGYNILALREYHHGRATGTWRYHLINNQKEMKEVIERWKSKKH